MKKKLILTLLTTLVSLTLGCESDLLDDPGFQFWSENGLGSWDIVAGQVEKVPTWHEHDFGASLVGAPVLITQDVSIAYDTFGCLRVDVIADVEVQTGTQVAVIFRDLDDEVISMSNHALATSGMERKEWTVDAPYDAYSVVFAILKENEGRAIFAELRAVESDDCF